MNLIDTRRNPGSRVTLKEAIRTPGYRASEKQTEQEARGGEGARKSSMKKRKVHCADLIQHFLHWLNNMNYRNLSPI